MAEKDRAPKVKSAYELALERMESQGIERPEALSDEARAKIAEIRNQAEAKLAELEILYHDRRAKTGPVEEDDELYQRERRRIEDDLERKLAKARGESRS